jgi:hypothetical protein
VAALVDRLVTFDYFIPTMVRLSSRGSRPCRRSPLSPPRADSRDAGLLCRTD